MEEIINTENIKNFKPLKFVEILMKLKLDQEGYKDITVKATRIPPSERGAKAGKEA